MLEAIDMKEKEWFVAFEKYLNSSTDQIEQDKEILNELKPYITSQEFEKYSTAINNFIFNPKKIEKNTSILSEEYIKSFWDRHKAFAKTVIQPLDHCPVCGISFSQKYENIKTIEHVLPKSKYHQYILSPFNLVYYCNDCNSTRGNILENRIFHPYFSNIESDNDIKCSLFVGGDKRVRTRVEVIEENEEIYHFINKIYKLHLKYNKFIMKIINIEISSIQSVLEKRLNGLDEGGKLAVLVNYIMNVYKMNYRELHVKTEIEKQIVTILATEIEKNSKLFARYVLDRIN